MKVAVVGGGIMGLSTARALAERGHGVTVYEQHEPGTKLGSSVGRSRIVRQAYPDRLYTEVLLEGHQLWQELEMASGKRLVHSVGLLYVGPRHEDEVQQEVAVLSELKVPHRVLGPADVKAVHPQMRLEPDEVAVHTMDAGWADVPAVLEETAKLALASGAQFETRRVSPGQAPEGHDRVVVTAGAWVTEWATKVQSPSEASAVYGASSARPGDRLQVTLQTFGYVRGTHSGPVWIEGFGDHSYGFPSEQGRGDFKIGYHPPGPETDPKNPTRAPDRKALAAIKEAATRRFDVKNPEIVESGACLYTLAPNDDFKIGWLGDQTLLASTCSGHGFKFGPWMGRFLADLVDGTRKIEDWPRWHWSPTP